MKGINKAIIVGTLGRDPEVRYAASGSAVCNLSVATSESWKDKNTGEKIEQTEWHRVVIYGKLAEIAGEYLRKGSKVYLEGSLTTRKWQDKETGQDRYSTEIRASEMQMLDGKPADGDMRAPAPAKAPARSAYADAKEGRTTAPAPDSFSDDDIPF